MRGERRRRGAAGAAAAAAGLTRDGARRAPRATAAAARRARLVRPPRRLPRRALARHRRRRGRARRCLRRRARPLAGRRRSRRARGLAADGGAAPPARRAGATAGSRPAPRRRCAIVFGELAGDAPTPQFPDERLKLMFVCAHPAIDPAARAGADAADGPRPRRGAHRLGLPGRAGDAVAAPGARQDQDPQRRHRLRGAAAPTSGRSRLADVLEAIYAAYGTGWDDVAGTDAERSGLAARGARRSRRCSPASRPMRPRRGACWRCSRSASRASRRAPRRRRRLRAAARAGHVALGPRAARRRRSGAAPRRGARRARARSSSRRRSSRRTRSAGSARACPTAAIVALYDALVALAADDRRARQPRLRRRRGATAPRPGCAALRGARCRRDVARLPAVLGRARASRRRRRRRRRRRGRRASARVGLSTDPAVRRFLLRERDAR